MQIWSSEIKELESLYTSIKGRFPDLEKELEQLIETKDANVVLLYSRRCLEIIVADLCERELKRSRKTEPLKGIIDKLHREEKVPANIITSMDHLNSLSTFGTHPKDFDPEQVKPVLINLAIIIKWYLKYRTEKAKAEEEGSSGFRIPGSRFHGVEEKVKGAQEMEQGPGYKVQGTGRKTFMIISGILIIAVISYIVLDQFNVFRKDRFEDIRDSEGKISIAVMPFENLTGDSTLNYFGRGISSLIINGLGNSRELAVLDDQTMSEVLEDMNQLYTAGISPSVARRIAEKLKTETYISGSFHGRENNYWILANMVNTGNGEIIKTCKVEGNLKSDAYIHLADSLIDEIKNYLEITALENITDFDFREAYPTSAEAYRYYIEGVNSILIKDYDSGIESLLDALKIDSTFTFASFYIAYAYSYNYQTDTAAMWTKNAYAYKDKIPPEYQNWLEMWYACYVSENLHDIYRYCNLLEKSRINSRLIWFDLGVTYKDWYCNNPPQLDKAIKAFEKVMEISLERGGYWEYELYYDNYANALHRAGRHEKEKEILEIGRSLFPDGLHILLRQAVCALSLGDNLEGEEYLSVFKDGCLANGYSESLIERATGQIYGEADVIDLAEVHYRKAYELEPQEIDRIIWLAQCLINNDLNVEEGMILVQKGLDIRPDNPILLWIKGRGYYMQGKYREAVELLKSVKDEIGIQFELCQHLQEAEQALANQQK